MFVHCYYGHTQENIIKYKYNLNLLQIILELVYQVTWQIKFIVYCL